MTMKTPEHQKPTFTDVSEKLKNVRHHIQRVRYNLYSISIALEELQDVIDDLEGAQKQ